MIDGSSCEQQLRQRDALAARQPRRRLVEHHQRRVDGARHAHLELALLAVRERADERPLAAATPDRAREVARLRAQLPVAPPQHDGAEVARLHAEHGEIEVVLDREPREEPGLLVRAAHAELGARTR